MGYFHVAPAFPQEPDNVQEESDASAANTSPRTCSARSGAGQELLPRLLRERAAGDPCTWLSTETAISCLCQSRAWEKGISKAAPATTSHQLFTSSWLSGWRAGVQQETNPQFNPLRSSPVWLHQRNREINKYASVLIHIMQWFLDSFWKGCYLSKIN